MTVIEKARSILYCAGVDEAGAGCGAGDLVVAAVVLNPENPIEGLSDSKKLTEKKREALFPLIMERALDVSVVRVTPQTIDKINILQARLLGFEQSLQGLKRVDYAVIDGNRLPKNLPCPADFLIQGDNLLECISAASIIAKVTRDRLLVDLDDKYPQYGFARHKGYLTKDHLEALQKHGPSPVHRLSYKPVASSLRN